MTVEPQHPEDVVLLLVDVVGYSPQARMAGASATQEFDASLKSELTNLGKSMGVEFIKPIGDAALMWCKEPEALLRFIVALFGTSPIRPRAGFVTSLRMIAHKAYFAFTRLDGHVTDVHGDEAILLFRLEKRAQVNRVLVTPHLFGGLRHSLEPMGIGFREETVEEAKGVGGTTPRCVFILKPPVGSEAQDAALPASFRARRTRLREDVAWIPVFGNLYPPIPMADNFLRLTLDLQRTAGMAGYYSLRLDSISERLSIGGQRWPDAPPVEALVAEPLDEPDLSGKLPKRKRNRRRRGGRRSGAGKVASEGRAVRVASEGTAGKEQPISADDLYAACRTGFVIGLPGAGKTTILRHFAWRALEEDPHATVLLVEARHLSDELVAAWTDSGRGAKGPTQSEVFGVLCALYLYPGVPPSRWTPQAKSAIDDCVRAVESAWDDGLVIMLIDGLDEAPTPALRDWLAHASNQLMSTLAALVPASPGRRPEGTPGRCYLSVRAAELERQGSVSATHSPVFLVNALDQEQIRSIARRHYGATSELYARFDDIIWRRPDLQRIAGTPLTAMLLVFFFHARGEFALRYAMYRLIVLFVLDRAWARIKADEYGPRHSGLKLFFHEVAQPEFLEKRPGLRSQVAALGHVAVEMLYNSHTTVHASDRSIGRSELVLLIQRYAKRRAFEPETVGPVEEWVGAWERENLLLPAGAESLSFLHATILEFLAAAAFESGIQQGAAPTDIPFVDRSMDSMEVLPMLCSSSQEHAWRVLGSLEPHRASFSPEATLPFRCLCEMEAAELENSRRFNNRALRLEEETNTSNRHEKAWAYAFVANAIRSPKGETTATRTREASQVNWLNERAAALVDQPTLCQPTLLTKYLASWSNDGTSLAKAQAGLLERMLDEGTRALPAVRAVLNARPRSPADGSRLSPWVASLRRFCGERLVARAMSAVGSCVTTYSETGSVLRLDLPGHNLDRNLAYLQAKHGAGYAGLLGSPNFKHGSPVNTIAFSRDGAVAVAGDQDGKLIVWSVATGRQLASFSGHAGAVTTCSFTRDGSRIVSGSDDGTLRTWNVVGGNQILRIPARTRAVLCCAVSPDGNWIVSTADDTLQLWDLKLGSAVRSFVGYGARTTACAFRPDGRAVLGASDDKTLHLWDVASGQKAASFWGHVGSVRACDFSPDGTRVLSASNDGTVKVWDATSGAEIMSLKGHTDRVRACAFSPDGNLIVSASEDGTVKLWDFSTGQEVRSLSGPGGPVRSCAFNNDGGQVLSTSSDNSLRLWEVASGRELHYPAGHTGRVRACSFSPDGATAVSGSDDGTLRVWDIETGREMRSLAGHGGCVVACTFSSDGARVLSASEDRTLRLWDAVSWRELRAMAGHMGAVRACGFSSDGTRIVSASDDKTLKVWDAASGQELATLDGHELGVTACAFSPDGTQIVSGSDDSTVRIWNVASSRELRALAGHKRGVTSCAFDPAGTLVASSSFDGTLRLWDAATGRAIQAFEGHRHGVMGCVFSSDGSVILSVSTDETLRVWEAATGRRLKTYQVGWAALTVHINTRSGKWGLVGLANGTLALMDLTATPR